MDSEKESIAWEDTLAQQVKTLKKESIKASYYKVLLTNKNKIQSKPQNFHHILRNFRDAYQNLQMVANYGWLLTNSRSWRASSKIRRSKQNWKRKKMILFKRWISRIQRNIGWMKFKDNRHLKKNKTIKKRFKLMNKIEWIKKLNIMKRKVN